MRAGIDSRLLPQAFEYAGRYLAGGPGPPSKHQEFPGIAGISRVPQQQYWTIELDQATGKNVSSRYNLSRVGMLATIGDSGRPAPGRRSSLRSARPFRQFCNLAASLTRPSANRVPRGHRQFPHHFRATALPSSVSDMPVMGVVLECAANGLLDAYLSAFVARCAWLELFREWIAP